MVITVKIPGIRFTSARFKAGKFYIPSTTLASSSWLRSVADFGLFTFLAMVPKIRRFGNIPFPSLMRKSDLAKILPNESLEKGKRLLGCY